MLQCELPTTYTVSDKAFPVGFKSKSLQNLPQNYQYCAEIKKQNKTQEA